MAVNLESEKRCSWRNLVAVIVGWEIGRFISTTLVGMAFA